MAARRVAHRDRGSLRDRNKYVDKVKMDQNAALDRHVLDIGRSGQVYLERLEATVLFRWDCLERERRSI
jgi:hypothetical protein